MKRTAPRRQSEKALSNRERRRVVVAAARRRDGNRCVGRDRVPEVRCNGDLQPHELILRSGWREGIYVLDNVVMLCDAHHRFVHDEPNAAHAVGLRRWSHERKDTDGHQE